MNEDSISTRTAKKPFRKVHFFGVADLTYPFFKGFTVWGVGALACYFVHISSYYALALAVVILVFDLVQLPGDLRVHQNLLEPKDHLVQISAQLVELQASLRRMEKHSGVEEARGVATTEELKSVVQRAIEETRATQFRHAKTVGRAARALLEGKAYDQDTLRNIIDEELEKTMHWREYHAYRDGI